MKIDPEKAFEILKKGNVLSFVNEKFEGRGRDISHIYVLLNTPVGGSLILVMVHASSKIDRIKTEPPETLIYVGPNEYSELTKSTVFNCNVITSMTKEEFVKKYNEDRISIKNDIDLSIVSNFQKGVLKSRKVESRFKKIIKKEIE